MKRTEVVVASATLMLVVYTLALSVSGQVLSSLQTSKTVSNAGTVKVIGVGVYWNVECTNPLSSINWGMLEPGSIKIVACYVRNEGNSASTLSMYTSNWNPSNASTFIYLTWNCTGYDLNSRDYVTAEFALSVDENISGIESFCFDITIVGGG